MFVLNKSVSDKENRMSFKCMYDEKDTMTKYF